MEIEAQEIETVDAGQDNLGAEHVEQENNQPEDWKGAMFGDIPHEENVSSAQPDGKEVKADETKQDADKAAASDEPKPEANPEEQAAGDSSDEFKEPDGLSEKGSERFRALANETKELRKQRDEWAKISDGVKAFQESVRESFSDTAEVENMFAYGKAVKSGDWDTVEKVLAEQVKQFEVMAGRRLSVDILSGYPDVKSRVESLELDEEQAHELARARYLQDMARKNMQEQQQLQQQQAMQQKAAMLQQQQAEAERQQAIADVNELCAEWARTDVLWQTDREKKIAEYARATVASLPPSQWKFALSAYYNGIKAQTPANVGGTKPLRAGNASGKPNLSQNWQEAMFDGMHVVD